MTDKADALINEFRENGGRFENMVIGSSEERGLYCSAINSNQQAFIFCPAHLLVDSDDVEINATGLFIKEQDKYRTNIDFLNRYFSFHFNKALVDRFIEEKRQVDTLTNNEKELLSSIHLYNPEDRDMETLEYVKLRIFQSYLLTFEPLQKEVFMPFVSLLNHDKDGAPFMYSQEGITVQGKFNGEVFVNYNMGDVLMFLGSHKFVSESSFIYSIPMEITSPEGITLKIDRNPTKFRLVDEKFRWPAIEKEGNTITVSWYPLFFMYGPRYPARVAAAIAGNLNLPAETILQNVIMYNLKMLLPVVFTLEKSRNAYVKTLVSGVKRQLEIMSGIEPTLPG